MKNLSTAVKIGPDHKGYLGRCIISLLLSHLVVLIEIGPLQTELLLSFNYYRLLAANALTVFLLFSIVNRLLTLLYFRYPCQGGFVRTFSRQLLWTLWMPIGVALFIFGVFVRLDPNLFKLAGVNFYMLEVAVVLLATNVHFFNKWGSDKSAPADEKAKTMRVVENYEDVAYIFISDKNYFALTFSNEKMIWPDPLSQSIKYLPSIQFFMLSRSFIINRNAIASVSIINAKKTKIKLLDHFNKEIFVSQRENTAFKKWLSKGPAITLDKNG